MAESAGQKRRRQRREASGKSTVSRKESVGAHKVSKPSVVKKKPDVKTQKAEIRAKMTKKIVPEIRKKQEAARAEKPITEKPKETLKMEVGGIIKREPVKPKSPEAEKKSYISKVGEALRKDFSDIKNGLANYPTVDDALMAIGAQGIFGAVSKLGFGTKATTAVVKPVVSRTVKLDMIKVASNAKTQELSLSYLGKLVGVTKNPVVVAGAIGTLIGTYPWAEWALGEAKEGLSMIASKVARTGDVELMKEYQLTSDEIFDSTVWENIKRSIPGLNIAYSFGKKAKSLGIQAKVNNVLIQDEIEKIEGGEDDSAKWERINTRKLEQEKEAVDYYNTERKKLLQWEEEAADRDMKEDAKFWAGEREKQAQLEKQVREDIAKFWTEYRKAAQKMAENNRPSKLTFGIL